MYSSIREYNIHKTRHGKVYNLTKYRRCGENEVGACIVVFLFIALKNQESEPKIET